MKRSFPSALLLLLSLSLQNSIYAQVDPSTKFKNSELNLKFSPTHAIDIFGSTSCLLSLERKSGYKSLTLDAGVFFPFIGYITNNRGWRAGLQYRKYLKKEPTKFISLAYMIKNQHYNYIDSIDFDGIPTYLRNVEYSKYVHSLSFIYGKRLSIGNSRFFTETFMGIGLRYKNTVVHGISSIEEENIDMGDSQVTALLNWRGSHLLPNFVFGFKIGYELKGERNEPRD